MFSPLSNAHNLKVKCDNVLFILGKTSNVVTTFSFFDNFSFNNEMPIVLGSISATNNSDEEVKFGTKMLQVTFNSTELVRAYKNTIVPHAIDFASITLKPNSTEEVEVYWVPKLSVDTKISTVRIICSSVEIFGY